MFKNSSFFKINEKGILFLPLNLLKRGEGGSHIYNSKVRKDIFLHWMSGDGREIGLAGQ